MRSDCRQAVWRLCDCVLRASPGLGGRGEARRGLICSATEVRRYMVIFFITIATVAGLAIVVAICLQTASHDAGFSAAMGGGSGGGAARKGGTDLMLERLLKVSAVTWILACLALAIVQAHTG